MRLKGQDRIKGDERILGDGDFVMDILSAANEEMDRRYELKRLGYDLDKIEQRVLDIYELEREELYSKSWLKIRSEARSVFCYWAVRELGVEGARLARRFKMSQAGIGYAVRKGEKIVKEKAASFPVLTGKFAGLRKFRIGDHRIIYTRPEDTALILRISPRRESYR